MEGDLVVSLFTAHAGSTAADAQLTVPLPQGEFAGSSVTRVFDRQRQ